MEHIGSLAKPDAPALRMVADMLAPTSKLGNFLRTAAQMAEDEGSAHFFADGVSEAASAEVDHDSLTTIADLVRPIAEIRDHGTHYADCHNWHVGCLARLVLQLANPTASQRPNEGK